MARAKIRKQKVQKSPGEIAFEVFIVVLLIIFAILIIYPLINLVAVSFSSPDAIRGNKVTLIPVGFNTTAYSMILGDSQIYQAYGNTIIICLVNCVLSLVLLCFAAYPLAFGKFKMKKPYSVMITVTMFLAVGIVPNYLIIISLGLTGSLWSIILTGLLSAYNIIVVRSYFDGLPKALIESARIDGANDMQILFRIILPCSTPILATVALWIIVAQWNSFMYPNLYLGESKSTLQIYLAKIIQNAETLYSSNPQYSIGDKAFGTQVANAGIVCSTLPVLIIFPFCQKFLVSGVTVGSVKE